MRTFFRTAVVAGVVVLNAFSAWGAFEDPLWTARSAALGGAMTVMGGDPSAVFYNPAATVNMERPAAHFTYAKLFAGLDEVDLSLNEFALVQPLKSFSAITLGWGRVNAAGLRREDTVTVGVSHLFRNLGRAGDVSVGMSGRALIQTFSPDAGSAGDPVFRRGRSRNDVAIDLHAHMAEVEPISSRLSLGLSLRAINRPDVGFVQKDKMPLETVVGVGYRWGDYQFPLDIVVRGSDVTPQVGVEGRFAEDRLALRLGTDTDQVGAGMGYRRELSHRLSLSLDYAFLWPLKVEGTSGSHRVTVGVTF